MFLVKQENNKMTPTRMPTPTNHTSVQSATKQALSKQSIISRIFHYIKTDEDCNFQERKITGTEADNEDPKDHDYDFNNPDAYPIDDYMYYGSFGVLFRCCLVNKLWVQEARKKLWKRPHFYVSDTSATLRALLRECGNDSGRQDYADLIEEGLEHTYHEANERPNRSIEYISFPNMKTLHLTLDYCAHVPRLQGSAVEKLILDPHYESCNPETYFVDQDSLDTILDEAGVCFPNVKEIRFVDRALAWPGTLQRFAKRMSQLEVFDHDLVFETDRKT